MGPRIRRVLWVGGLVAALAVAAVAPVSAAGVDRQDVAFDLNFITGEIATEEQNDHVLRANDGYFGTTSAPGPLFGHEAGTRILWKVNVDQQRATVSGSYGITGCACEINWGGEFHGRFTAEGGSGTISAEPFSSPTNPFFVLWGPRKLTGSWTSDHGVPDVTAPHGVVLHVTGVVTGSNLP